MKQFFSAATWLLFVFAAMPVALYAVETVQKPGGKEQLSVADGEVPEVSVAETMPAFRGGPLNDFRIWVNNRVAFPKEDRGIHGPVRVFVFFVVDENGYLCNVEVKEAPSEHFTAEIMRVLEKSPRWQPGKQNGRKVRVRFLMPVDFVK